MSFWKCIIIWQMQLVTLTQVQLVIHSATINKLICHWRLWCCTRWSHHLQGSGERGIYATLTTPDCCRSIERPLCAHIHCYRKSRSNYLIYIFGIWEGAEAPWEKPRKRDTTCKLHRKVRGPNHGHAAADRLCWALRRCVQDKIVALRSKRVPEDGAVRLRLGHACNVRVQVSPRYRLCCRSNQLGHHAAFKDTHAATALPPTPDFDDDSLERLFVSKPSSSCSAVKAEMWTGLTWADRFTASTPAHRCSSTCPGF